MMRSVPATAMLARLRCETAHNPMSMATICQRTAVGAARGVASAELLRGSKAGFTRKSVALGQKCVKRIALAGSKSAGILRFTRMLALRVLFLSLLMAAIFAGEDRRAAKVPRGKPIRAPEVVSTQQVVRLPGGIVITNVPGEFLPRTTNIVRLPSAAARKYEPLGYQPISFTELARFFITPSDARNSAGSQWESVRAQIPEDVLGLDGKKVAL